MNPDFTLNDFRQQLDQFQKMGMTDLIPGVPGLAEMLSEGEDPEVAMSRIRSMINSMTEEERNKPDIIDSEGRARIAKNCGIEALEVEGFLAQFKELREFMRQAAGMSFWQRVKLYRGGGTK